MAASMLPVSALALELPELDVLGDVVAAVEAKETSAEEEIFVEIESVAVSLNATNSYTINGVTVKHSDSTIATNCWTYAQAIYNKI